MITTEGEARDEDNPVFFAEHFEGLGEFEAIHSRHSEIDNDEVKYLFTDPIECFLTIGGATGLVSVIE